MTQRASISIWDVLGIDATGDERSIKRAYAKLLKSNRPEDDPDAFQRLRDAYEHALRAAFQLRSRDEETAGPVEPELPEVGAVSPAKAACDPVAEPAPSVRERPRAMPLLTPAPDAATMQQQMADADREARALWQAFVATASVSPRLKLKGQLKTLDAGEAMLNFMVRDGFEVHAARYCAGADCPHQIREAVVQYFGWQDDFSHLLKLDPQAAYGTVGRYRARQSHEFLEQQSPDILKVLLSGERPKFGRRTPDVNFTRTMRQMIEAIRWRHPELLHYEIDAGVLDAWEKKVQDKRYFIQSGMFAFLGGLGLTFLSFAALWHWQQLAMKVSLAGVFFGSQALAFALSVLFFFRQPAALFKVAGRIKQERIDVYLYQHRYRTAWQHGWLLPFAALSLLLFLPEPGPLTQLAVSWGLFGCMLAAFFAGSAMLTLMHWMIVAVMTLAAGFLMANHGYADFGPAACLFGSACAALQAVRGGEHLYMTMKYPVEWLPHLRGGWLAACVLLFFCLDANTVQGTAMAILIWVWCLAGLLLSRFVISALLIWPALLIFCYLVSSEGAALLSYQLRDPHLPLLIPALLAIGFFMLLNMYDAAKKKQYFS